MSQLKIDHLFVYGSLAPGRPNEHILSAVEGTWQSGTVRGILHQSGWGAALGFPGLTLDPAGQPIQGQVLSAAGLVDCWPQLDAFEGPDYQRIKTQIKLEQGQSLQAWVYVLRNQTT